jgi:NCAIR mutase (PurE)-related protein
MESGENDFVDLGFARADTGREARTGFGEVIFAAGKTVEEVLSIAKVLVEHQGAVLATRVTDAQAAALCDAFPEATFHGRARCVTIRRKVATRFDATVAVCCAGTSDLAVAEEAAVTLEFFGIPTERVSDAGVAGIHRLLASRDVLDRADVVIVVAGMEGALPSVVGGLVGVPVIAAPTSVGYGASFQGLAALLGMLNSCASGLTVVNIDNGFGAAMAAARIVRILERRKSSR